MDLHFSLQDNGMPEDAGSWTRLSPRTEVKGAAWGAEVAYLKISAQQRTACPPQYVVLAHITWDLSLIIEDYKSATIASADCFDKNITTDCFDKIITLMNS